MGLLEQHRELFLSLFGRHVVGKGHLTTVSLPKKKKKSYMGIKIIERPTSNMTEVRNNAEECFQAEQLDAIGEIKAETGGESVPGSQYCDGKGNVCYGTKTITCSPEKQPVLEFVYNDQKLVTGKDSDGDDDNNTILEDDLVTER